MTMKILRTLLLCAATVAGAFVSQGQTTSSVPAEAPPRIKAAASTFAITPIVGMPSGHTRFGMTVHRVFSDLKSTIVLLQDCDKKLVIFTSALSVEGEPLYEAARHTIADVLKMSPDDVIVNSAHNHSVPAIDVRDAALPPQLKEAREARMAARRARADNNDRPENQRRTPNPQSIALGKEWVAKLRAAAESLPAQLVPVTVKWSIGHEDRVTYNRRTRRPGTDSAMLFVREEDRAHLPENYKGMIDTDATVVVFDGAKGPVAALGWYTGHPVTVYNPEDPTSFGEWPQVACDRLSAHLGGIPVGFVQGCAGDINSKYMFSGTLEQATQLGNYLGDAFIEATKTLQTSKRAGFQLRRQMVDLPLRDLPSRESLERDIASMDDFIKRGEAGDEDTYACVGMNFPKGLTPKYRATLVKEVYPWYVWALDQYKNGNENKIARTFPIEVVVARFGDVGFVGMPSETLVRTGLKIKYGADLPCVLPCGYTGVSNGYIPDAFSCYDLDYVGGNYRYRRQLHAPYGQPGGDAMANAALITLNEFARTPQK